MCVCLCECVCVYVRGCACYTHVYLETGGEEAACRGGSVLDRYHLSDACHVVYDAHHVSCGVSYK